LNLPDSYESAVLDFLDREMAAVQPSQNKQNNQNNNDQSEEVDALVSDLLRQVITESDTSESAPSGISDEFKNLAIEFPPEEEKVLYARSEAPESPVTVTTPAISQPIHLSEPEKKAPKIIEPEETSIAAPEEQFLQQIGTTAPVEKVFDSPQPESVALPTVAPVFTAKLKSSNPKIAIVTVCLLAAIGLAAYFGGSSKKSASKADSSQPLAATSETSGAMIPAVPISQIAPRYPEFAISSGASATIVLNLEIDDQGKVLNAVPVSGPYAFHKEAINAAKRWKFRPASINGTNVASQSRVTMNFKP
jgi:protein TonB